MTAPRSYLFVPGDRPDRFDKARASGADAVIVDLEDAVPIDRKSAARDAAAAWLSSDRPVVVRINAIDTVWFADDAALCRHPGVAAVMLAKSERADDVAALRGLAGEVPVVALVETAAGLANARALAAAPGVERLAFGSIDFQLDMNLRAKHDELAPYRAALALASRLANLAMPIDSPCPSFDTPDELEAEAARARRDGFGAKLCIHPKQAAVVNRAFSPSAAEIAWAERVLAAADASQGAAVAVDGRMVDKPVILRARALLAERRGL